MWSGLATTKLEGQVPANPRRRTAWYLKASREEWDPAAIDRIATMVIGAREAFDSSPDGRPAFVARAILAVLLDKPPTTIGTKLKNFGKARRVIRESSN
jgi:hypothetical protein